MLIDTLLSRLVIIRTNRENSTVGSAVNPLYLFNDILCVITAYSGNQRNAPLGLICNETKYLLLFRLTERSSFAGGAEYYQVIYAASDLIFNQAFQCIKIDAFILIKGSY